MNIFRSVLLCSLLLLTGKSCLAVDANKQITQYAHTAWRIEDGFFSGAPSALAQTKDGYLWIGSDTGLFRFDGVRFVEWNPPDGKQLPGIISLLPGSDGSLWIGTDTHLARLKDGHLTHYLEALGRINSILEDRSGSVWIARSRVRDTNGPICQVAGVKLQCHGTGEGITSPYASALFNDDAGNLWIGSSGVLTRWKAGSSTTYINPALKSIQGLNGIQALSAAPDGSILVGIMRRGHGLGLQQLENGTWKPFRTLKFDGSSLEVISLFLDREKSLWIGTATHGIFRFHNGNIDRFSTANGLSGDAVSGFYEDREGNLWVTTDEGIDCFRSISVISFSTREGLSNNVVDSVLADRHGVVWIGNEGGLDSLREENVTSIHRENGLPGSRVTSLLEDHTGHLWVGVDDGLSVYDGGRFIPIQRRDGTPIGVVIGLAEDQEGNIWAEAIGSPARLLRIKDRIVREETPAPGIPAASSLTADPHDGIWLGLFNGDLARYRHGQLETYPAGLGQGASVRQILVNSDDSALAATSAGLIGWKSGKMRILTARYGLPCNRINSLTYDSQDNLWLYTQCGLVEVENRDLQKWWQHADALVQVRVFDAFDGARPSPAVFQPRASRSPDGRLWFASDSVLQMIDPAHLAENVMSPPVRVEELIADRKSYAPENNLRLPPVTRNLEINYTALSFVTPQKVRFRYKLENHDLNWQEPGTRRQAFYNGLPPGRYRFRVIACNNDGVWNEVGAMLDFRVMPAWYQTTAFRVMCFIALLCIVWTLYRLRVRQIAYDIGARFDERLAERTRIAGDLHDTLLQTIQGSKLVAIDALGKRSDEAKMRQALEQLSLWLEQATEECRTALNSLRSSIPLRDDLAGALQRASENGIAAGSLAATLCVTGKSRFMHPLVREEVYCIGCEAIRNAQAHSGGTRLEVELQYGLDLALRIRDNGIGMDPAVSVHGKEDHFGLQVMRERAARIGARLNIASSAKSGTEIALEVPGPIAFIDARSGSVSRLRAFLRRNTRTPRSK